ncbi:MAG: hypothetical protein D3909_05725 [Candidatus Electrothrix sp. ATG1]|nr:hypothetical protein [Candidatus Electrothrix sp. ATG1]
MLLLRASVFLRQEKPDDALVSYRQADPFYRNLPLVLAGKGKALAMLGDYNGAALLVRKAVQQNDLTALLLQAENSLRAGNEQEGFRQLAKLLQTVPLTNLINNLHAAEKDPFQIPLNETILRQAVLTTAERMLPNLP